MPWSVGPIEAVHRQVRMAHHRCPDRFEAVPCIGSIVRSCAIGSGPMHAHQYALDLARALQQSCLDNSGRRSMSGGFDAGIMLLAHPLRVAC